MFLIRRWIFRGLFLLSDIFSIYLSFWLSYQARFYFKPLLKLFPVTKGLPNWLLYEEALRIVIPLWILVFAIWGKLYQKRILDAADEFLAIAKSAVLATLCMFTATFLYRQYEYSRLVMGICFLASIFIIFTFREILKIIFTAFFEKWLPQETILVLGEGKSIGMVVNLLKKEPHKNVIVLSSSELKQPIKDKLTPNLKEIFVSNELLNLELIQNFLDLCEENGAEIKILPDLLEMRLGEISVDDSLGLPILHLKPLSLHGFRYFIKRSFDVSISILVITALFLPLLLISFLITINSKGGAFFLQERVGFKEKKFNCLKFRTMFQNAESLLKEWDLASFRGGPAFKMRGDPRITKIGIGLRRFSLDELPQIWNVLKSEMSLIGPRPQVIKEADGNPEWAKKRFRILPGITGLWQVSGRADLSYEEMMRLDIYYVENWTPGLDLKILLKTIPVVLFGKGAY
ncbi:MAG: sugar transferase [Elusimicrobia bacterium]|nr:sugar transferase [Elusimicrobiota bacterium]